jgi:hypothetical protein
MAEIILEKFKQLPITQQKELLDLPIFCWKNMVR